MPPDGIPEALPTRPFLPPLLPYSLKIAALLGRQPIGWVSSGIAFRVRFAPLERKVAGPVLRFRCDDIEARLVLDAKVADALLRAAEPAPRAPHGAETAALLLEYALAEALGRLEEATGASVQLLGLESSAENAGRADDCIAIGVEGEADGAPFQAALLLPPCLLDRVRQIASASLPPDPPPCEPPVVLAIRLGLARLDVSLAGSLVPGDAVVPDVLLAPNAALVVIGERLAARGRLDGGRLVLESRPVPVSADWKEWTLSTNSEQGIGDEGIAPPDAALGELQVTLVFELGRRALTLAKVRELAAGHVIELGPIEARSVTVLANGARIGCGELVRAGSTLAVRLTRLAGT